MLHCLFKHGGSVFKLRLQGICLRKCPKMQAFTRTERELFSSEKLRQNDIFSHERRSLLETELNAELMRQNRAQFTVQKITKALVLNNIKFQISKKKKFFFLPFLRLFSVTIRKKAYFLGGLMAKQFSQYHN